MDNSGGGGACLANKENVVTFLLFVNTNNLSNFNLKNDNKLKFKITTSKNLFKAFNDRQVIQKFKNINLLKRIKNKFHFDNIIYFLNKKITYKSNLNINNNFDAKVLNLVFRLKINFRFLLFRIYNNFIKFRHKMFVSFCVCFNKKQE